MEVIKRKEDREALRTKPGRSWEAYASIAAHCNALNTHESTDRRLVYELTGHKLTIDGDFVEETHIEPNTRDTMTREPSHLCKSYHSSNLCFLFGRHN